MSLLGIVAAWLMLLVAVLGVPPLAVAFSARFTRDGRWLTIAMAAGVLAVVAFAYLYQQTQTLREFEGPPAATIIVAIGLLPGLLLGALAVLVASNRTAAD